MKIPHIASIFTNQLSGNEVLEKYEIKSPYICVHIRRGDYLNVASKITSNEELLKSINSFRGLTNKIVIVSDSEIDVELASIVRKHFKNVITLVNMELFDTFKLMQKSDILIGSNSQLSLTAGLLSKGHAVYPKTWFGKNDDRMNKIIIKSASNIII